MTNVIVTAFKRFINEKYSYRASALTYTTLLAIVPLLLSVVSAVAIFPEYNHIIEMGNEFILNNFLPSSANVIQNYFEGFAHQAARLSTISFIFLIFTAFMLIYTIEETFDEIWKVTKHKHFYSSILNFSLLFIIPILIGLSVFLVTYIFTLPKLMGIDNPYLAEFTTFIIPLFVNTIIFSFIFIILPNTVVPIKAGLIGGSMVAILLEVSRRIFIYYILKFSTYSLIYGAFATIPVFLIWLYIFWCIILFCAEITYLYSKKMK